MTYLVKIHSGNVLLKTKEAAVFARAASFEHAPTDVGRMLWRCARLLDAIPVNDKTVLCGAQSALWSVLTECEAQDVAVRIGRAVADLYRQDGIAPVGGWAFPQRSAVHRLEK